jgi:hypothetical protein
MADFHILSVAVQFLALARLNSLILPWWNWKRTGWDLPLPIAVGILLTQKPFPIPPSIKPGGLEPAHLK